MSTLHVSPRCGMRDMCGMWLAPALAGFVFAWQLLASPHVLGAPQTVTTDGPSEAKVANTDSFESSVAVMFKEYCISCHGENEASGDRRFDKLSKQIADENSLILLQDALDQLNLGTMPPEDESQPPEDLRSSAIQWLTKAIADYQSAHAAAPARPIIRRLNAREYRNVIRDLFGMEMAMFDPTRNFPKDQQIEHLDNNGDALITSGHLLARYLDAADTIVEKAMYPTVRPKVETWRFTDGFRQQPEIDQVHRASNKYKHLTLYDVVGADKHEGAYAPIHAFDEGVPHDGYYDISFRASAVNRDNPYEDDFLGIDRREPFKLGIVAGNKKAGPLHKPQPVEPLLAELDLTDAFEDYSVRVWLDAGYTPRFTFRNGLMDVRNLWTKIQKRYPDLFPEKGRGIVFYRRNAITNGKIPQIHIDDIEISGPHFDDWPKPSQLALLGESWEQIVEAKEFSPGTMGRELSRFLGRAYRRPSTQAEVERLLALIGRRMDAGRKPLEAYADAIKAALCSPSFLYWESNDETTSTQVASRLSAFLWASLPDERLTRSAVSGELRDAETLANHVERMLADPKSDAFLQGFLGSWLTLKELGSTPPDRGEFRKYYHYDLGSAMREETRLFARHLLDHNLSVANFLDSDFTFVNKRLAQHYGIPVPAELKTDPGKFVKVNLIDRRRGGLLGQASVLTVSANGIDTSPVVRGVWLLENLLGMPPSPPPPDVEPLDPDVRGAKTIREQLEKHRNLATCNECHRKIDPLGFALENFDPVGQWRETYRRQSQAIDASGTLGNGGSFRDVREFKQLLLERKAQFARALTEKLLAYALGRQVGIRDRPAVDLILEQAAESDYGFRDLIRLIVLSPVFRA